MKKCCGEGIVVQAKYLRRDVRAVEKARVQIWRGVVSAGNRGDSKGSNPGNRTRETATSSN